jgi:hypothetical protein
LQEAQIPAPLELPIMFLQRFVRLATSPALRVDGVNGVSVTENVPVGLAWMVVPHAAKPVANVPGVAAELLQLVPVPFPPARVETSLTTTDVGRTAVAVLLIRLLMTEIEASPSGVTRQEQQDTSSSPGSNA